MSVAAKAHLDPDARTWILADGARTRQTAQSATSGGARAGVGAGTSVGRARWRRMPRLSAPPLVATPPADLHGSRQRLLSDLPQVAPRTPCRRGLPGPSTPSGRRQRFPEPLPSGRARTVGSSPNLRVEVRERPVRAPAQVAEKQRLQQMAVDRKTAAFEIGSSDDPMGREVCWFRHATGTISGTIRALQACP